MHEDLSPAAAGRSRPVPDRRARKPRRDDGGALAEARLLYVEDDAMVREQLAEYLRRRVKELQVAENGKEALRLFQEHRPDLLLTDIKMPGIDGLTLSRQFKARDPSIPIVVLSAFSDSKYLLQAIEVGVERYVLKPVDATRLVEALEFCAQASRAANSRRLSQAVVDSVSDAVAIIDAQGLVVMVNPAFGRVTGWPAESVLRHSFAELVDPEDKEFQARLGAHGSQPWRGEFRLRRTVGAPFYSLGSLDPVVTEAGHIDYRVLVFFDNTDNRRMRDEMRHLAHYDSLTGLPNRLLFDEALRQRLAAAQAGGFKFALLFVDLDRFKQVNDVHGHSIGDLLLREVSNRLRSTVREDDLVSRRSGDEFVIILGELGRVAEAHEVAGRIRAAMEPAFELEGRSVSIRCSVGVAIFPRDGQDARNLLRKADMAMYRAKAAGGDRSCAASGRSETPAAPKG